MLLYLIWHWITSWLIGWGGVGALVCAAAWLLWFFCPAMLLTYKTQLLYIALGATFFTFASTYFFTSGYNKGYATAINHIASQNKEASDAVKKAISSVDQCNAAGGTWDTVGGVCER